MKTNELLSPRFVLLAFVYSCFMFLAICSVGLAVGCIYWTLMASLAIAKGIRSSWQRLRNSGYGWSKRQKPLLPRSDYGWRPEL